MKQQIGQILLWSVLAVAIYFAVFHFIDKSPIYIYDEAIYANNALEMTLNNEFIVLTNGGQANLYNTKPPLVIWLQSLCMRLFGLNELALRLPSALSVLVVISALILFSKRILNSHIIGIVATLTLITSLGYIRPHVVRSGDLDAVLVMWTTLYGLLYLAYLLEDNWNETKCLLLTALGVVLAFYTKSTAAFLPILGLLIATFFSTRRKTVFKNKYLYLFLLGGIAVCALYYVVRESASAGYLDRVIHSEYLRLHENIMPWHEQPYWFYWNNFVYLEQFMPYVFVLPFAILFGFLSKEKINRQATLYFTIYCLTYMLVISYPPNKLNWYDAPLYPFFALLIGILMNEIL